MRIIVRSKDVNLWLPIPLSWTAAAVNLLPESAVADMRSSVPAPYNEFITKEFIRELVHECQFVLKQYKGLEMVHAEAQDGTYISIRI